MASPPTKPDGWSGDLQRAATAAVTDLQRDCLNAVASPAAHLARLGAEWWAGYLDLLARMPQARSPEERMTLLEAWQRTCLTSLADCTTEIDKAALAAARQMALDSAHALEVEALSASAPVQWVPRAYRLPSDEGEEG